jgi:hypothetical protein
MYVLISSTMFVWNISLSKKKWARNGLHVKYTLLLPDFNGTLNFSTYFRKMFKYQLSWQSVQWGPSCYVRTSRQTLIVTIRNIANAPKMFLLNAQALSNSEQKQHIYLFIFNLYSCFVDSYQYSRWLELHNRGSIPWRLRNISPSPPSPN